MPTRTPASRSTSRRAPAAWGTVEQLPSGRWRAFYRRDGQRISAPATFSTKDAANGWLAGEHADHSRGVWRDPHEGQVTLAEFAEAWLSTAVHLRPRTVELYRSYLTRWVLPRIGDGRGIELGTLPLSNISPVVVRTWFAAVHATARDRALAARVREAERRAHPARVWAREQGHSIASSGRLSPTVLEAWRAAGAPTPAPQRVLPGGTEVEYGRTAAAQAYRLLRTVLATAVREGVLTSNPCQIPGAGTTAPRERGTATPQEVAALAAHMPAHLAAAVTVAAWSGLRYGELFALARRHVDLDAGTLRVERAVVRVTGEPVRFGPPKTRKSARTVHLPGFVLEALRAHLDAHVAADGDALLFTTMQGGIMTTSRLHALFARARAVIGRADLAWHDLRHTGATLAYRAGASVPEVQSRLGHSTNRAAMIYAHAADDSDRELAGRLDAMFSSTQVPTLRAVG